MLDRLGIGQQRICEVGQLITRLRLIDEDWGDRFVEIIGNTNPEISTCRAGHFILEKCAERFSGCATDKLANRPTEIDHMIAIARARFPERFLIFHALDHIVPIEESAGLHRFFKGWQRTLMVEHHGDRGDVFAMLAEFGPVIGDRRVQVELSSINEYVCANCGCRFGAGKDD